MSKSITLRLILDLVLFIAILNGWWFVALPLILIGIWAFPFFVESIVAGIGHDALFGFVPEMGLWGYAGTIVSVVSLFIISTFKNKVR